MPKRNDIHKILLLGSGPIVIGQACEFDYSGTQACKALREEGFEVVLANSNPATIMTDPGLADQTYVEPLTPEFIEAIIEKERPDAILPTLGGQTALNLAMALHESGVLEKYQVEMLGADHEVIKKAEDRETFRDCVRRAGLDILRSAFVSSVEEARQEASQIGYPVIIRPSYTLGGTGGGIAHNEQELEKIAALGIESSMIGQVSIEESVEGWKEYELEVMRDNKDNVVIVCSIENLDAMGVHTGDSITVAPAQTLSDVEYQKMRNGSLALIREVGVETGGSNIQFAVDPKTGRMIVIEMNPRVSRSSALASKATGFPIAKFAAKLAIGYSLDEIRNDITRETPASFEPTIDYCVVKVPRFTFEKFSEAEDVLGVQMKSVGETMAIGRTFKEALQKALRGLETGHTGLDSKEEHRAYSDEELEHHIASPNASRIFSVKSAIQRGWSLEKIYQRSGIDPWFLAQMAEIVKFEQELSASPNPDLQTLRRAKELGFSDAQLAALLGRSEDEIRAWRKSEGIVATFKQVDTCAAEFEAHTPYYYSTYETEDEALEENEKLDASRGAERKKIMILGGGPNRIGQGIEFDYCCCHAAFALQEMGYETIMVNSNPETVSTDYDTSDRLYFEPLTFEDVMNIVDVERPDGVIVQYGGQTPLNLARRLHEAGVLVIGTSVDSIDKAENRDFFSRLLKDLGILQPANGSADSTAEAVEIAERIGYPVLARPSYVIGGRAMKIVYDRESLLRFVDAASDVSPGKPVLIDKFIEDAIEVDVDAVSDGEAVHVTGIMEHIESAGIHSGDSACVIPPPTLGDETLEEIRAITEKIAKALHVIGLLNIQFAVKSGTIYVLEANPRASRTVPFVSKATGVPVAKIAAQVMTGRKLAEFDLRDSLALDHVAVKESVLPFSRFSGVDIVLGPEMKSTGEVMGIASDFRTAFAKSQICANQALPESGRIFISVKDDDKRGISFLAEKLESLGFSLVATHGTAKVLRANGVPVEEVDKRGEGERDVIDLIRDGEIHLVINTISGKKSHDDLRPIRAAAIIHQIPCISTLQGAWAAVNGIEARSQHKFGVRSLQDYAG